MKDIVNYKQDWDYKHFLAYMYIAVANSDYEISEVDLDQLHQKLSQSIFNEIDFQNLYREVLNVYNKQNDIEVFNLIEALAGKYITTEDKKTQVLKDIQDIIDDDGYETGSEHIMLMSIKKILNAV